VELKRTELAVLAERAVLVGASTESAAVARESLEELRRLAETADALVAAELVQRRRLPDGATYLGKGKVEELAELCRLQRADVVIMDVDLSAAQVRNLERMTDCKVIDRTELILDIFARGARTAQARDQVELAQLEYAFPRLRHMWTHLERVEGGIGMRGPGERQIETDRRLVRRRIEDLKRRIAHTARRRALEAASRSDEITACLVGYTNAGKSTLMNALTGAGVLADDKLFSTLDTRTRACDLGEGRKILLSDTVGFIRHLPHHLVASFHATLEEARQADLLLHVVDISSPQAERQMEAVMEVLRQIGCADRSILCVGNKVDLVEEEAHLPVLRRRFDGAVMVSALTGAGIEALCARIRAILDRNTVEIALTMPPGAGKLQAFLAEHAEVLSRDYGAAAVRMTARIAPRHFGVIRKMGGIIRRLRQRLPAEIA
jgi:GTP-binding protein HflX